MKILYVITKANWGGAQKYVYDLAVASKEAGHDVAVAYGEPGALVERLATADIRTVAVIGMKNKASFKALDSAYRALDAVFAVEKPDIVHLNSSLASAAGALAGRKNGITRIVFTSHGWAFNEDRPFIQKLSIKFFAWLTIRLSHETICVSEAVRSDIRNFPFIQKKLVLIHNGIECEELLSRESARSQLSPNHMNHTWIGMVSELHPTKRIADALVAMQILGSKYENAFLIILGGGTEEEHLKSLAVKLGIENRVMFFGFLSGANRYLSAFDIFLHPSRSEALGYAILEAGCASLPTVACSVGGIPEIIEDSVNGLLVEPENPAQLAEALETFLAHPEKARALGEALHTTVTERFSKEKMIAKTLALYRREERKKE